jgi:hypothetical protein
MRGCLMPRFSLGQALWPEPFSSFPAKSVRKRAANGAPGEKALGDAAKAPLAEPDVPVSANHKQICADFQRDADQLAGDRSFRMLWLAHRGCDVMAREISGHIVDTRLRRLFPQDFNNSHGRCFTDQRQ